MANCYEYSDFTSIFGNNVVYDFSIGKVREVSVLSQCLYGFVSVLPAYLIIFFFVIFMGVLTTSTISAVSSTFGVYLFYDLLSLWLKPKVLAYLPFYCWDLSPYMYGGLNSNIHSSFGLALLVDIVTILVLMLLAFIIFKKKEIKNQ
jgi:ABC-type transport system involved in multi-copper enzyme maturation permease subunit